MWHARSSVADKLSPGAAKNRVSCRRLYYVAPANTGHPLKGHLQAPQPAHAGWKRE